jgi:hypothetical protein
MIKVFIGGSRRVTRLNAQVRQRLDRIIDKGLYVLIGDANGADKAVQRYLHSRAYDRVEVFCVGGICRNNIGNWETRIVEAPQGREKFEYYAAKDAQMTKEASIGFMLWDGQSRGTLANVLRLLQQGKKVVIYLLPQRWFLTLRNTGDFQEFFPNHSKNSQEQPRRYARPSRRFTHHAGLF